MSDFHPIDLSTLGLLGGDPSTLGYIPREGVASSTGGTPVFVTRRRLHTEHYHRLGHVFPRTFLRKDYQFKRVTYLVASVPAEITAEATLTAESSLLAQASMELLAQSILACQNTLLATASNALGATTLITCQSGATCTATNELGASSTITGVVTLIADATVAGMTATLSCSCTFSAEASVEEAPEIPGDRVDWENTLGAAPGPVGFGGGGGWRERAPTIAITFIYGKHIYSDVKRRRRDITVDFESLTQEVNEIKIDLVGLSRKTKKPRFKMKANNGKVHLVEK